MHTGKMDRTLSVAISLLLIAIPFWGYEDNPSGYTAGGATDAAPLGEHELQDLVAPIALYPDPLVAQIVTAATFPDQVAVANYWLQENKELTGQSLAAAVNNNQSWNASVKALTRFPSVLNNMAQNLAWTSSLGEAYHNQPSGVMSAIQTLRAQAKNQGSLKSGPQITVTQESPQTIVIEPTNPQMVYVPQYNPAVIYGTPYVTPGYQAPEVAAGSLLGFGSGVALGALAGGAGCCGWGWDSWGANWHAGNVVYNHNNFYGNPAWHGGYYNGAYHSGYGYHNAYDRAAVNYKGYAGRAADLNRADGLEGERGFASSWARADDAFRNSNAFSGFDDRIGGHGGWQSRAESLRGWGSMREGGFGGGRFGGGRFGGGGFRRGGFRR